FVLRHALIATEEFLKKAHDEIASIRRGGPMIIEWREFGCKSIARLHHCCFRPSFAEEKRLGFLGTCGCCRHTSECKARMRDDVGIVRVDDECRSSDGDIEFAALANLI